MPDAQFLQDQVFIRVPSLHAGDHHTPGVQLAGHFCRESLVAPAKQQGKHMGMGVRKHMGMGVRKLGSAHHVGMGIEPENAQLFTIRSEEQTSELQSLMRSAYAVYRLKVIKFY